MAALNALLLRVDVDCERINKGQQRPVSPAPVPSSFSGVPSKYFLLVFRLCLLSALLGLTHAPRSAYSSERKIYLTENRKTRNEKRT
jgi:hypothetical protein